MDERTAGRLELVGLRARRLLAPRTSNGATAAESFDGGRGPPHAGDERRIATRIAAESSLDADSANAVAHDIVERAQSALDRMLADDWNGSLPDEDAVALESVLHVRGRPALRVIGDRPESLEHHPGSEFWQDLSGDYEDRIVAATAATGAVIVSWFSSGNPPWVQGSAWLTAPNRVVTNRQVLMSAPPESHLVASASDGSAPKIKSGIELYLDFTFCRRREIQEKHFRSMMQLTSGNGVCSPPPNKFAVVTTGQGSFSVSSKRPSVIGSTNSVDERRDAGPRIRLNYPRRSSGYGAVRG